MDHRLGVQSLIAKHHSLTTEMSLLADFVKEAGGTDNRLSSGGHLGTCHSQCSWVIAGNDLLCL